MKRFIRNLIIFVLAVSLCSAGIVLLDYFGAKSQYENGYLAALQDKTDRLKSLEEPKIILVGNSNLAFGMDSETVERETGMPTVNLGLHGGLGNAFQEEIAKLNINKGDIVVVCHSHFSDNDDIPDREVAWAALDNHSELFGILRKKDYIPMLMAYPNYVRSSLLLWITGQGNADEGGCYSRSAFNKYGDVVVKPESKQMDVDEFFKKNELKVPEINDICIQRLNELNKYVTDRGAVMLVAGYPIAYGEYSTYGEADFAEFKRQLQSGLDCEIISDYTDYFYPYEYFYNTALHLTNEGSRARAQQLAEDLKNWMEKN